jgi:hypothetical protein
MMPVHSLNYWAKRTIFPSEVVQDRRPGCRMVDVTSVTAQNLLKHRTIFSKIMEQACQARLILNVPSLSKLHCHITHFFQMFPIRRMGPIGQNAFGIENIFHRLTPILFTVLILLPLHQHCNCTAVLFWFYKTFTNQYITNKKD